MATYLTGSVDLRRECGVAGTGPAAVTGQTGDLERIVEWYAQTYIEIQNRHDWLWLRSTWTVDTASNDDTYAYGDVTDSRLSAVITRFKRWWLYDVDGFPNVKCYLTSAGVSGEKYLLPLPWASFRDLYKRGTQTNNAPVHVTVDPQRNLLFGPKPNAIYTVTGEYQMSAQVLAADGDTPEMPSDYHQLIVYKAMEKYGGFSAASEVLHRAITEGNRLMRQLERNQRPECGLAGPLA